VQLASGTGRIWAATPGLIQRLQVGAGARWLPRMTGDDYAVQTQFRAGKTFGNVPFDELFILGLERDNDLRLRAHIGTRDGRKGSAPMGRQYLLFNWEIDKVVYNAGFLALKLSPFLDIGRIANGPADLAPRHWLCDTGIQLKVQAFGVGFAFTFGKDLRSGKSAFYLAAHQ
jgi:hypothetical protein